MTDSTISYVVNNNLCTGCGICFALCPKEAIKIVIDDNKGIHIPKINKHICNNCSLCIKVCPGHEINFKQLNLAIFGKYPHNQFIGNYLNCYVGYSNDPDIRYNSSSGGIITQLLIFALEEGIIDGALVTRMKKDNPLKPEPFIARNKKEIIEASKSKYCPVPANIAIKEILKSKNKKFAVVGLPCHIHGIRKAEQTNKSLKEKIVLHMGLFCHHGVNLNGTQFFLERFNIESNNITKLNYRGQGWPGFIEIISNNTSIKKHYPYFWIFPSLYFFTARRCFMCPDTLNELADISFGDAWLPEFSSDTIGTSILISRTEKGEKFILDSCQKNKLLLNKSDKFNLIKSQIPALYFKKKSLKARIIISKLIKKPVPSYKVDIHENSIINYPIVTLMYLNSYLSSIPIAIKIMKFVPLLLFKGYRYAFYKIINSRIKI